MVSIQWTAQPVLPAPARMGRVVSAPLFGSDEADKQPSKREKIYERLRRYGQGYEIKHPVSRREKVENVIFNNKLVNIPLKVSLIALGLYGFHEMGMSAIGTWQEMWGNPDDWFHFGKIGGGIKATGALISGGFSAACAWLFFLDKGGKKPAALPEPDKQQEPEKLPPGK